MKMLANISRLRPGALALLLLPALAGCATAQQTTEAAGPARRAMETRPLPAEFVSSNAAWMGHAFVTTASVIKRVPQVCAFMRDHQVTYWFVNLGLHAGDGSFSKGAAAVPRLAQFLNAVDSWEKENKHTFKVVGWLNGTLDEASPRFINLRDEKVTSNMLSEVRRFMDPGAPGSYLGDSRRMLDGIQYDLEPSGKDVPRFEATIAFMRRLRAELGPGKLTSFTPHKWGDNGRYWWSSEFFYRMAPEVDLLGVMTYDSGIKDEAAYREWMQKQTIGVLDAVSGAIWKNDAAHPAPARPAKILIGFPGFPANNWHDLKGETMLGAIAGTQDGMHQLLAAKSPSARNFGGGAVYLYTDGQGGDGYSTAEQWSEFRSHWLGK